MGSIGDYDAEVKAIRAYNQPILDEFRAWLKQSGLSEKTIRNQVSDIDFFTEYLVYYDPLEQLDEAGCGDVHMFLADWFPRKALWASVTSVKSYVTSFKKFFQWMGETGRIPAETVADVITTLKENRDEYLEAVSQWSPMSTSQPIASRYPEGLYETLFRFARSEAERPLCFPSPRHQPE